MNVGDTGTAWHTAVTWGRAPVGEAYYQRIAAAITPRYTHNRSALLGKLEWSSQQPPNDKMRAALLCALALGLVATGVSGRSASWAAAYSATPARTKGLRLSSPSPNFETTCPPLQRSRRLTSRASTCFSLSPIRQAGRVGVRQAPAGAALSLRCPAAACHALLKPPSLLHPTPQERYTQHFPPGWGE